MLSDEQIFSVIPGGVLDCLSDPWDEGVGDGDEFRSIQTDVLRIARAIEAEVRAQDETLILQLVEALEDFAYEKPAREAIAAGRARLEGKP